MYTRAGGCCISHPLCGQKYDWMIFGSSDTLEKMIEEEMLRNSVFEEENSDFESAYKIWKPTIRLYDRPDPMPIGPFANDPKMLEKNVGKDEDDLDLLTTLINPRTFQKVAVADLFKNDSDDSVVEPHDVAGSVVEPREEPKPYHAWTHDHDYFGKRTMNEENSTMNSTKVSKRENEPIVEVWKIDGWKIDPQTADPDQADGVQSKCQVEVKGRRSSTRAAELKQKMQHRRITSALRVVELHDKVKRTRQRKNVRPKNSVETTPSQSDLEEWSSVPTRRTQTKVTKKKTTKGRIDHSESERLRREVLRKNFAALSELVPIKYLRGEKASSQISKQKILNGAKAYIGVLRTCKATYKINLEQNKDLLSRWQDRNVIRQQIEASRKCMKKK